MNAALPLQKPPLQQQLLQHRLLQQKRHVLQKQYALETHLSRQQQMLQEHNFKISSHPPPSFHPDKYGPGFLEMDVSYERGANLRPVMSPISSNSLMKTTYIQQQSQDTTILPWPKKCSPMHRNLSEPYGSSTVGGLLTPNVSCQSIKKLASFEHANRILPSPMCHVSTFNSTYT